MKKSILYFFAFLLLLSACSNNYEEKIVGWWLSDDATPSSYVGYIINDNGRYTKRMKSDLYGASLDGTDKGTWKIKGSYITFYVETYNDKKQEDRVETYEIHYLKDKKLILRSEGCEFCYIKDE